MALIESKMKSKVACVKVNAKTKEDVLAKVKQAMELADWRKHVKGNRIFIKPNCMTDLPVPGICTSPWVVEGVIKVLRENTDAQIFLGDADGATARRFDKMIDTWGYDKICRKYGVKVLNLSKQKIVSVKVGEEIFDRVDVPKILLDMDCIVSVPVIKTHALTVMTGALKNQWGCLTRVRHQYHLNANQCIAEINKFLNVTFVVADATVCMEGMGPAQGFPKVVDYVFAGDDRVAVDSLACDLMMIEKDKVGQLEWGKRLGVGTDEYQLVGDALKPVRFKQARIEKNIIVNVEMKLRKVPILSYLIFKTPLFRIPAWITARYNLFWSYNLRGKKRAREFVRCSKLYRKEFGDMIR